MQDFFLPGKSTHCQELRKKNAISLQLKNEKKGMNKSY